MDLVWCHLLIFDVLEFLCQDMWDWWCFFLCLPYLVYICCYGLWCLLVGEESCICRLFIQSTSSNKVIFFTKRWCFPLPFTFDWSVNYCNFIDFHAWIAVKVEIRIWILKNTIFLFYLWLNDKVSHFSGISMLQLPWRLKLVFGFWT